MVVARLAHLGSAELLASQAASAAGDVEGATVHARRAAMAYFPGAAHVAASYRKLRDLAVESEARGDLAASLFAWRAVRSAALGTRFLLTPRERERQVADANIARLSSAVRQALLPRHEAGRGAHERESFSGDAGGAWSPPPNGAWGLVALGGIVLWLAALARLAAKGWDAGGNLSILEAKRGALLAAGGLLAWCIGLYGA
jgi:hypothetical protein